MCQIEPIVAASMCCTVVVCTSQNNPIFMPSWHILDAWTLRFMCSGMWHWPKDDGPAVVWNGGNNSPSHTEPCPKSLESLAAQLWEHQQLGCDDSLERCRSVSVAIICRCFCCNACFCFRVRKQYTFLLPLVFYCASVVTHGATLTVSSCALCTELFQ